MDPTAKHRRTDPAINRPARPAQRRLAPHIRGRARVSISAVAIVIASSSGCLGWCPIFITPPPLEPLPSSCCVFDDDCGAGAVCGASNGVCNVCESVFCVDDSSCADGQACDIGRGRCEEPLVCDGFDLSAGCTGGELCLVGPSVGETDATGGDGLDGVVGACRAAPLADRCELVPASATLVAGVQRFIDVVAFAVPDPDANPDGAAAREQVVPLAGRVRATATGLDIGDVDDGGDAIAVVPRCAGPAPCRERLTVDAAGVRCSATLTVLPERAPGDVRVVVVDDESEAPLAGVEVVVVVGAGGPGDDLVLRGQSDVTGTVVFRGALDDPSGSRTVRRVSAFFAANSAGDDGVDHDWLTLLSPSSPDLVLPLRAVVPSSAVPALTGRLVTDVANGDLRAGLAGMSLGDAGDGLTAETLFGVTGTMVVEIEGLTAEGGLTMAFPSGGVLALGTGVFRERFVAWGRPGPRLAWSLASHQLLSSIGETLNQANRGFPGSDVRLELLRFGGGSTLAAHASSSSSASSPSSSTPFTAARPTNREAPLDDIAVTAVGGSDGAADEASLTPDVDVNADVDVVFDDLPPRTSDVVILVGAVVPGRGLVLLGATAVKAIDATGARGVPPGTLRVPYAPPHRGLEGLPLVAVIVAVDVDALSALDDLGGARVVRSVAAPAPDRTAQVLVGRLDGLPAGTLSGGVLDVDDPAFDAGFGALLRLSLARGGGASWRIVAPRDAAGAVEPIDVNVLAGDVPDDVEGIDVDAVERERGELASITWTQDPYASGSGRHPRPWSTLQAFFRGEAR